MDAKKLAEFRQQIEALDFDNATTPELSTGFQNAIQSVGRNFKRAEVLVGGRKSGFRVEVALRPWAAAHIDAFEANNVKEASERTTPAQVPVSQSLRPPADDFTGKKGLLLKLLNELLSESHI